MVTAKRISGERMSALAGAILGRRWELAALCLVLGILEAVSKLPADAMAGLLAAGELGAGGREG